MLYICDSTWLLPLPSALTGFMCFAWFQCPDRSQDYAKYALGMPSWTKSICFTTAGGKVISRYKYAISFSNC